MSNIIRMILGGKKKTPARTPMRDVAGLMGPLEHNALHVVRSQALTKSHLGGGPGLPGDIEWPHRDGVKLRFLARLSLSELQAVETTSWLPSSGALLFFYDDDKQPWGFDPADRGGWVVLHVPDVSAAPQSSSNRPGLPDALPFASVILQPIKVLPSWERPDVQALGFSDEEHESYYEIADRRFKSFPKHQMLGLPSPVQGDSMELECQLASNGVNCGHGYDTPRAKELEGGAKNWRLLFQMDSDDDLGVMWGDGGMLYFWVEEAAARRGDFSNVWLVLQCS